METMSRGSLTAAPAEPTPSPIADAFARERDKVLAADRALQAKTVLPLKAATLLPGLFVPFLDELAGLDLDGTYRMEHIGSSGVGVDRTDDLELSRGPTVIATFRFSYTALTSGKLRVKLTGTGPDLTPTPLPIHKQPTWLLEATGEILRPELNAANCLREVLEQVAGYAGKASGVATTESTPVPPVASAKRKIITLIGSTRFKKQFEMMALNLTRDEGATVLGLTIYSKADGITVVPALEVELAAAHKQRIALADEIYVIDVDGYMGEGTQDEIAHAESLGKHIRYLSAETAAWRSTLV